MTKNQLNMAVTKTANKVYYRDTKTKETKLNIQNLNETAKKLSK